MTQDKDIFDKVLAHIDNMSDEEFAKMVEEFDKEFDALSDEDKYFAECLYYHIYGRESL